MPQIWELSAEDLGNRCWRGFALVLGVVACACAGGGAHRDVLPASQHDPCEERECEPGLTCMALRIRTLAHTESTAKRCQSPCDENTPCPPGQNCWTNLNHGRPYSVCSAWEIPKPPEADRCDLRTILELAQGVNEAALRDERGEGDNRDAGDGEASTAPGSDDGIRLLERMGELVESELPIECYFGLLDYYLGEGASHGMVDAFVRAGPTVVADLHARKRKPVRCQPRYWAACLTREERDAFIDLLLEAIGPSLPVDVGALPEANDGRCVSPYDCDHGMECVEQACVASDPD